MNNEEEIEVFISLEEIKEFLEDECKDFEIEYSEDLLSEFSEYLSIDMYDWFKENFRSFVRDKIRPELEEPDDE